VSALGRFLGYSAIHVAKPPNIPLDVPKGGLTPVEVLKTYNATPLAAAGFTGKGATIVLFEADGYDQKDLDRYAKEFTPKNPLKPIQIGGQVADAEGEATMDLAVAHAIAPDAKLVVINFDKTFGGATEYATKAQLMQFADQQYPGAVWSHSYGSGCDRMGDPSALTTDLAPVQAALAIAESHGTSAFTSSGDTGGFECASFLGDWSSPPGESDKGLDAVASLPEMTDVGGTSLSTDATGAWIAEATWLDSPTSQGTGGGVSAIFDRPKWQTVSSPWDATHRLTPDVAADADPYTGVKFYFDGKPASGGGTSQSAPIWAALTVLMNQFLVANGGHPLGDINPVLYRVAAGGARPAFHDVILGGNAIYNAAPGYDLVTGLGTPDVDNLVHDILDIQKGR
ncbi:MAG: S53 family peptidase, partial [Mycobacterium sp.]